MPKEFLKVKPLAQATLTQEVRAKEQVKEQGKIQELARVAQAPAQKAQVVMKAKIGVRMKA